MESKPLSIFFKNETPEIKKKVRNFFLKQFDINRAQFDANPGTFLFTKKEYKILKKSAIEFAEGKDVTFKLGYKWFYNVRLNIQKGVFVPQSDTEGLIDLILNDYKKTKKNIKILEIGSGSGAISIALAKNLKKVNITSIDISKKALNLALINAVQAGVYEKIEFKKLNFLKQKLDEKYDVIVSNPPYIGKKDVNISKWVKKNQPSKAIHAKHAGVNFYSKIFTEVDEILNPRGKIYLEIGFKQEAILSKIIPSKFKNYKFYKDLNKKYRYLVLER